MRAALDGSGDRFFALALAASVVVHAAALLAIQRTPMPSSALPEASTLWVRILEPMSTPIVERGPDSAAKRSVPSPAKPASVQAIARAARSESPVAVEEAAVPAARDESSLAALEAPLPQATSAGPEPEDAALLVRSYADTVSQLLDAKKRYPPAALARGWQGAVTLGLDVLRGGRLDGVEVIRSSGYPLLDSSAVSIARSAQPFPAFAASLPAKVSIRVNVVFRIGS